MKELSKHQLFTELVLFQCALHPGVATRAGKSVTTETVDFPGARRLQDLLTLMRWEFLWDICMETGDTKMKRCI